MEKKEEDRLWKSIERIHYKIDEVNEKITDIKENTAQIFQKQDDHEENLKDLKIAFKYHVTTYHESMEKTIKEKISNNKDKIINNKEGLIRWGAIAAALIVLLQVVVALKTLGLV